MKLPVALLEQTHDLVLCWDQSGEITHAGPRPWPGGVFTIAQPQHAHLEEALTPAVFNALLELMTRTDEETPTHSSCALDHHEHALDIHVARQESAWIALMDVSARPQFHPSQTVIHDVLDALGHGAMLLGPGGDLRFMNAAARHLIGADMVALGRTSADADMIIQFLDEAGAPLPFHQHPASLAATRRTPVRGHIIGVHNPLKGPEPRWFEVDAVPHFDDEEALEHIVCSIVEVTDHLRTLQALRQDHSLLQQVMHTSAAGITLLDPTGQIIFANRTAEEILGLCCSEIACRSYDAPEWRTTTLDGGPWPDEEQPFVRVLTTREPVYDVRHAIEWPDGTRRALSINGAPVLDDHGEVSQLVFTILDITEQLDRVREQETMRHEMQELARMESLSVMASGVAHDFNNLLVGMLGAAHAITDTISSEHAAHGLAGLILQSAQEASMLTRQLLAYSGRGAFNMGQVQLPEMIEEMSQLMRSMISRDARLELELEQTPLVRTDMTQLRQILLNLVLNASQALNGPGTITVRTRAQNIAPDEQLANTISGTPPPGRYALVEVEDNGPGMDEEVLRRVFEPFYTTKERGHGLGLSAVLGVVRSNAGFVQVESNPGEGARFTLGLPTCAAEAHAQPTAPTEPSPDVELPERVLVIDDETVVRRLVRRLLEHNGCTVYTAEHGVEGVQIFRQHHETIDAALVDMTMPRLGGLEVVKLLRELRPDLPVVITSGYADEHISDIDTPIVFLSKPFTPSQLYEALRHAARVRQPIHTTSVAEKELRTEASLS